VSVTGDGIFNGALVKLQHCRTLPEHYHNIARNFNISLDEESAGQKPTTHELKVKSLSKS